jgi:cytoskeletal protein RodZ
LHRQPNSEKKTEKKQKSSSKKKNEKKIFFFLPLSACVAVGTAQRRTTSPIRSRALSARNDRASDDDAKNKRTKEKKKDKKKDFFSLLSLGQRAALFSFGLCRLNEQTVWAEQENEQVTL